MHDFCFCFLSLFLHVPITVITNKHQQTTSINMLSFVASFMPAGQLLIITALLNNVVMFWFHIHQVELIIGLVFLSFTNGTPVVAIQSCTWNCNVVTQSCFKHTQYNSHRWKKRRIKNYIIAVLHKISKWKDAHYLG